MRRRGLLIAAFVMTWSVWAWADEWPVARAQHVFSPNSQHFVRIVPGSGDRPVDASPRIAARGEFYARQPDRSYRLVADVALQNPAFPVYAIVTDDGFLVTFDDWFGMGVRNVMVFYRPTGALIRALSLEDLYAPEARATIPRSTSSLHWRCAVYYTPPQGANGDSLTVWDHDGGVFTVDVKAGTFEYRAKAGKGCEPGTARTMF